MVLKKKAWIPTVLLPTCILVTFVATVYWYEGSGARTITDAEYTKASWALERQSDDNSTHFFDGHGNRISRAEAYHISPGGYWGRHLDGWFWTLPSLLFVFGWLGYGLKRAFPVVFQPFTLEGWFYLSLATWLILLSLIIYLLPFVLEDQQYWTIQMVTPPQFNQPPLPGCLHAENGLNWDCSQANQTSP